MAIVFITEANGPIRVCNKQATADAFGIASADIDLSGLTHPTEHYTLVGGALVELTDLIYDAAVQREQEWVSEEMIYANERLAELEDGDPRGRSTTGAWQTYRRELRDRVTGGVIVDHPTTGGRPVRPDA